MKEYFLKVLSNYREIKYSNLLKKDIESTIKKSIPSEIEKFLPDNSRYVVDGSIGKGNIASVPWVAIFDKVITTSAQEGYYPVYLFCDDMSGFYLSLNQGVTLIEKKYKKKTKSVLKQNAEDFRVKIGAYSNRFNDKPIILGILPTTKSKIPELYETGNIISKYYPADGHLNEEELKEDLLALLSIYNRIPIEELDDHVAREEDFEIDFGGEEDPSRFKFHKRIERNASLARKVKKFQGYRCKCCDMSFIEKYGEIGKDFIEAHHLVPLSKLEGKKIGLDIRTDFVVLCSNCHRMIHRLKDPSDLEELKNLLKNT